MLVVILLLILQVVLLGPMVDGPREEEEVTGIQIQAVEEGCRIAGDKEHITIDLCVLMTVVIK